MDTEEHERREKRTKKKDAVDQEDSSRDIMGRQEKKMARERRLQSFLCLENEGGGKRHIFRILQET